MTIVETMAHYGNGLIPKLDGTESASLDLQSVLMLQIRMRRQNFSQTGKEIKKKIKSGQTGQ